MKHDIFCDGASRKDGRGGWGYSVWVDGVEINFNCGGTHGTTNNRMELQAAIEALQWCIANDVWNPTITSDSEYVVKGITEYIDGWLINDRWLNASNKPVKNKDLWLTLGHLDCDVTPRWQWVKGHSGHPGNERADQLAGLGVPEAIPTAP